MEDNVLGQLPAYLPLFGLAGGHAAVVLLGQARRAVAGTVLLRIIITDDITVLVAEIDLCLHITPALVLRLRVPFVTIPVTIALLLLLLRAPSKAPVASSFEVNVGLGSVGVAGAF